MELTDTNRPRACLLKDVRVHCGVPETRAPATTLTIPLVGWLGCVGRVRSPYCFGDHCVRETPGPIPNPEVKPFSADGTARGTVWETRTLPDIYTSAVAISMATAEVF